MLQGVNDREKLQHGVHFAYISILHKQNFKFFSLI